LNLTYPDAFLGVSSAPDPVSHGMGTRTFVECCPVPSCPGVIRPDPSRRGMLPGW
jgi:hypothetical protein